ncbi:MAG: hypothetical protein AAF916_07265 [Planctomycetota bacterium]
MSSFTPTQTDWELPGAEGETIFGTAHFPEAEPRGVLLIAHGFKGYKDYGLLPMLADRAAKAGFIAHRFNFSHSGVTPNFETFERAELFERDTWMKQRFDLCAVGRAAQNGLLHNGAGHPVDLPQVWFGHSRGGVSCLLAAAYLADSGNEQVVPSGVVTAGSPHVCCSLSDADRTTLLEAGRLLSPSGRTGEDLYVGKAWLEEQLADPAAHDPYRAAGRYPGPRLILHGTGDATVPVASAHAYDDAVGGRGRLVLIEGASHVFDAPNPLPLDAEPPTTTQTLIEETLAFASECVTAGSGSSDDAEVE